MILALLVVPVIAGIVCFFIRDDRVRRAVLIFSSCIHLVLTSLVWIRRPEAAAGGWFGLDSLAVLFLGITSLLFFGSSVYGVGWLSKEKQSKERAGRQPVFYNTPEAVFTGCLLLFLAAMTLVMVSRHFAVLWVAMEATTLASAPLIYFHRHKRSLEAAWKYLLICSIGIALALLGIFFLAVAGRGQTNPAWVKAGFLFIFAGYGTKMGLAPFHTWLPDAHSEAPSMVSALLSGALLNCAFLGILRAYQFCAASGLQLFCQEILKLFGILSILFAGIFILGQSDYKRMLAYSSIEHMGILALGIGLGGEAVFGVMLNAFSHSLTKAGLFFAAGNILNYYRTKHIFQVHGVIKGDVRISGILWLTGFFLITGTPPSGIFFGEFIILKTAIDQGHYWIMFIFLAGLAVIFIGMARIFISMLQGIPDRSGMQVKDSLLDVAPVIVFFIIVIAAGLYMPSWLVQILSDVARSLEVF